MASSGPSRRHKNLKKYQRGLCLPPATLGDWLVRLLAAALSRQLDRGLSNSQPEFNSTPDRRLCLPSLCDRHFFENSHTSSESFVRWVCTSRQCVSSCSTVVKRLIRDRPCASIFERIYAVAPSSGGDRVVKADRTKKTDADADRPRRSASSASSHCVHMRSPTIVLRRLIGLSSTLSRCCRFADTCCNVLFLSATPSHGAAECYVT